MEVKIYFRDDGNKKETYILHQNETVGISRTYNEERGHGKFNTHRTNSGLEGELKAAHHLRNLRKCLTVHELREIAKSQTLLKASRDWKL